MRTDDEKKAFVQVCRIIEKVDGDVLSFIETQWPSYTPRGTWYNLQKQFLNRKENRLTEGKPSQKGDVEMPEKGRLLLTAKGVIECMENGYDIRAFLLSMGYKDASSALANTKMYCKQFKPELYPHIAQAKLEPKPRKQPISVKATPEEKKPVENPVLTRDEVESVFFGGKEYEKLDKPSPTCCQPARPSGVTVPDEVPAEPDVLTVCGVMGSLGRFEQNIELKGEKYMTFVMHMQLTGEDIRITFSADQWKTMLKEIPMALRQLGLSK